MTVTNKRRRGVLVKASSRAEKKQEHTGGRQRVTMYFQSAMLQELDRIADCYALSRNQLVERFLTDAMQLYRAAGDI